MVYDLIIEPKTAQLQGVTQLNPNNRPWFSFNYGGTKLATRLGYVDEQGRETWTDSLVWPGVSRKILSQERIRIDGYTRDLRTGQDHFLGTAETDLDLSDLHDNQFNEGQWINLKSRQGNDTGKIFFRWRTNGEAQTLDQVQRPQNHITTDRVQNFRYRDDRLVTNPPPQYYNPNNNNYAQAPGYRAPAPAYQPPAFNPNFSQQPQYGNFRPQNSGYRGY